MSDRIFAHILLLQQKKKEEEEEEEDTFLFLKKNHRNLSLSESNMKEDSKILIITE